MDGAFPVQKMGTNILGQNHSRSVTFITEALESAQVVHETEADRSST
jgi:hypothetical protein